MYLNQNQTLDPSQRVIRNNAESDIWKLLHVRVKVNRSVQLCQLLILLCMIVEQQSEFCASEG